MKTKFYAVLFSFLVLLMSGCQLVTEDKATHDPKKQGDDRLETRPVIATDRNWHDVFSPLIAAMVKAPQPAGTNSLLISDAKNNTTHFIPSFQINKAISEILSSTSQYTVIDKATINEGKHLLGLSFDDAFVSRSKMIALARHLGTDLVLFSSVDALPKTADVQPTVTMELLSAKTGEIIWRRTNHPLDTSL